MTRNSSPEQAIISVAVPLPLRQTFDFFAPNNIVACSSELANMVVGARVRVPFGNRKLIGVITEIKEHSSYSKGRLKQALELIDEDSIFDPKLWHCLAWISHYYLAPIGVVLDAAMPVKLRQGQALMPAARKTWKLSDIGRSSPIEQLDRAPLQLAIVKRFMRDSILCSEDFKEDARAWRSAIKALLDKNWIVEFEELPQLADNTEADLETNTPHVLTAEQTAAVDSLIKLVDAKSFSCTLLHGVTGSGKTEVYFEMMQKVIESGKQVLFLVPEIGLTPQLVNRIRSRFSCPITLMHSGLNDTERHLAWWHAQCGNAQIILGTRSAVFSSFAELGLVIVDEEHDSSYKQQDGVRYQARDVAIYRAKQEAVPIVLGSATPSLESYVNAERSRYNLLRLEKRATQAELPIIELFDTNMLPSSDGLSPPMIEAIKHTLSTGKQAMLFLNRRGYAPVMYCKKCAQSSKCHRCDSHLTLHRKANRLRCHHCGYECAASEKCNSCGELAMVEVGDGTQRVEEAIEQRFSDARVLRIDRDSTRRKGELEALLEQGRAGEVDIILGTQLITKGHDFPNVAMVGVLGADQGLYSTDFRASEMLFQQILQVAGRAGRRDSVGRVYIQTAFPNHPFFDWIKAHDFNAFAQDLMQLREQAAYPPFGYFALLRAESTHQAKALQFLRRAKSDLNPTQGVRVMDAIPAPMERRAGKFRAQLLICADRRSSLNQCLQMWLSQLNSNEVTRKLSSTVRWSLDIDPADLY